MSAELVATLAVGVTLAALILAYWYDMRRNFRTLSAETRAEIQGLCEDLRANIWSLRTGGRADLEGFRQEVRADIQNVRVKVRSDTESLRAEVRADFAHVRGDLTDLRRDVQTLTVRMARVERFLVGFFAARGPLDRHDAAA